MYYTFISRGFLKPDIIIKSNDKNLADFLAQVHGPFACMGDNMPQQKYDQDTYMISALKLDDKKTIIQCSNFNSEVHTSDTAQIIENLIYERTYACPDIMAVHGAAVSYGSTASLLLGFTASGKSTLCTYMLHRGFGYITDDIILINKTDMNIIPFPKNIFMRSGGLDVLKNRHGIIPHNMKYIKYGSMERQYLRPLLSLDKPDIKLINIFFIERSTDKNICIKLCMSDAFIGLKKNLLIYKRSTAVDIQFICRFISSVKCHHIIYSDMEYIEERILNCSDNT